LTVSGHGSFQPIFAVAKLLNPKRLISFMYWAVQVLAFLPHIYYPKEAGSLLSLNALTPSFPVNGGGPD
tara:strand:- start:390 stop:596 length:207 start_codon:yes stop_codon:yes gene_type:complete